MIQCLEDGEGGKKGEEGAELPLQAQTQETKQASWSYTL